MAEPRTSAMLASSLASASASRFRKASPPSLSRSPLSPPRSPIRDRPRAAAARSAAARSAICTSSSGCRATFSSSGSSNSVQSCSRSALLLQPTRISFVTPAFLKVGGTTNPQCRKEGQPARFLTETRPNFAPAPCGSVISSRPASDFPIQYNRGRCPRALVEGGVRGQWRSS